MTEIIRLDEALLRHMWPRGDSKIPGLIEAMAATSEDVFRRRGITTSLQVAHIMAQLSLECGAGTEVVENLNYTTPAAMMRAWPSRFPTAASCAPYLRNPKRLADKVYNGRMGNRPGSDDGYNFRGRGGSQTTGREAYEKLGAAEGHDLIANPDLLNDPELFLDFAVADFIMCDCLRWTAPRPGMPLGDINAVTHHLNGGYNGLADRKVWFAHWCKALGVGVKPAPVATAAPVGLLSVAAAPQGGADEADYSDGPHTYDADSVLRFGQHDNPVVEVKVIQRALADKGYRPGKVDGSFGNETRKAVLAFQADNGLPTTGEVDDATKRELETAPPAPVAEDRAQATAADLRAEGSQTIAAADTIKKIGWGTLTVVGGGKSLDAAGALDKAHGLIDQASSFRGIVDSAGDLFQWAGSHWWIGAIGAGVALVFFGEKVIARRVADHRSGANMAR
jgi:putative chitinase